jgi:MPBQ/MSBQ methyltransferase
MPAAAEANLTKEELSLIEAHLREQYRGVFDEQMIASHINEFVSSSFADNLAAVMAARSRPGDTLLDIGAGYGAFVLACRRHGFDAGGFELAGFEVDISRNRLARAEPAADAAAVFRRGDAGRLPYPDDTFKIVSLLNVLEHVPNYRGVLAEAVRVLRPGGNLLIICPNYAAFRKEAHYHVPWVPFFPRRLASAYLRLLGRNPRFFEEHIYCSTNWGVLRALARLGVERTSLDVLRFEHPELISSNRAKLILKSLDRLHLLPLVKLMIRVNLCNPLKTAVTVIASKKAPR